MCLKELGYNNIIPVVVDMGYEVNWSHKIKKITSGLGLEIEVVHVRDEMFRNSLDERSNDNIKKSLKFLDGLEIKLNRNVTPCTECYNTKITAITSFAAKLGLRKIVFGHHGTDAIASFLKSAFMYIDRWDNQHEIYTKSNFEELVENLKISFFKSYSVFLNSDIARRLKQLTELRVVGTDESPVQTININDVDFKIFRPLFNVFEETIRSYKNKFFLLTEDSGCGHSLLSETQTPRELIHYGILQNENTGSLNKKTYYWLLALVKQGLNKDGTLIVNVRNQRENILGDKYKINFGCSIKI